MWTWAGTIYVSLIAASGEVRVPEASGEVRVPEASGEVRVPGGSEKVSAKNKAPFLKPALPTQGRYPPTSSAKLCAWPWRRGCRPCARGLSRPLLGRVKTGCWGGGGGWLGGRGLGLGQTGASNSSKAARLLVGGGRGEAMDAAGGSQGTGAAAGSSAAKCGAGALQGGQEVERGMGGAGLGACLQPFTLPPG